MDNNNNKINIPKKVRLGFFEILSIALTIAFIVLKLCKVIAWSWLWVLAPLWIIIGLDIIVCIAVVLVIACIHNANLK